MKMAQEKRWSLKYDCCVECGGKDAKHIARGLCVGCYNAEINEGYRIKQREKYGLTTKKLNYEYLDEEYVKKEKSLEDIAKDINCSRQFVYKQLREFNIPLRTKQKARQLAYDKNKIAYKRVDESGNERLIVCDKIHINENFFSSWSKEMAYVLGVVYTDGSIDPGTKLNPSRKTTVKMPRLSISQKEPELLNKVLKLMNCDAKLYHHKRYISDEGIVAGALYTFSITNEKIYHDLIKIGLTPDKSKTILFPNIPQEYIRHFIRGCWDGDGSVYLESRTGNIGAAYVSGSANFSAMLILELAKAGLSRARIYKKKYRKKLGEEGCSYSIRYRKREDCWKLYRLLYQDVSSDQYLERKYKVFENYFGKLGGMRMSYSDRSKEILRPREMLTFFEKYCKDSNYKITDAAKSKLQVISQILQRDKVFIYAETVKKFFVKATARQAKRISGIENITDEILCIITEYDIPSVNEFGKC